jgi:hypothetical protein
MLIFNDNFTWKGKGQLSEKLYNSVNLQFLLSNLIRELKEAGSKFEQFITTHNRLIGQERYELSEELEDLIGGFLFLYKHILKIQDSPFNAEFCDKGKSFTVGFEGSTWRVKGVLRQQPVSGSFAEWYNTFLLVKTAAFIQKYGGAYADGVIDEAEKEQLCRGLNEIIFQVLSAVKGLKSGELS